MREAVILIHGLWRTGADMWQLQRRLQRADYECHRFRYKSLRCAPEENARRLHEFVGSLDAPVIHFVCHSLGGMVLLHYFDKHPLLIKGRAVLLGSPVNGSIVAQRLSRYWITRWLVGHSADGALLGGAPVWRKSRDLGVIAGTLPLGIGLVTGCIPSPHDGTVAVQEACLQGATDFITLPVSHTGLLYSAETARQVVTFLRAGKFGDEAGNLLFETELT